MRRFARPRTWKMQYRTKENASYALLRALLALLLMVLMVDQPLLGASIGAKRGPTARAAQPKGESQVLHALNRLTFGPRPGDVQAVEAMGLRTWFENQLNPEKIDDSALEAKQI